ncbi:hypothetical protein [Actinokineospora diospyrosa]|uniref:Uncharacterized protein n=1 Tax=Actinokineospora diospyrosa TaxID=103728 RepID=A0ABT1IKK0_9PSEU|nr:hypothetical protein [Actinokineospora diospyrosa]MCP2272746.1 hypothetical protein [Actinokineospora diospyrosa]
MGDSAEQRLYGAVRRWQVVPKEGLAGVIDAACLALVDGLDSPALRDLAGASPRDSRYDVGDVVTATLAELGIPEVGTMPLGCAAAAGGGVTRRDAVDVLRLDVVPGEGVNRFQVVVEVNGTDMTRVWGHRGVDPDELLIPDNLLSGGPKPRVVPIAVLVECCEYDSETIKVTVTRDGDRVHWDWPANSPIEPNLTFGAAEYDAELARVGADHSWETPLRTAGRLVQTGMDRDRLRDHGLEFGWVGRRNQDPEYFRVTFAVDEYQVFVDTPWLGRGPEELARAVCESLALPLEQWRATWSSTKASVTTPPSIAGPSWQPTPSRRP